MSRVRRCWMTSVSAMANQGPSSTAKRRSSQFGMLTMLSDSTVWPPMSSRRRLKQPAA